MTRGPVISPLPAGLGVSVSWWTFNCYVLNGDGCRVVVDPGLPSIGRAVSEHLRGSGRPRDSVVALATHGHADHVGGLRALADRTDAVVHLPALCREYLEGRIPLNPGARQFLKMLPVLADQPFSARSIVELAGVPRRAGYSKGTLVMDVSPTGYLEDGNPPPGLPDWEVISTPGHTEDSVSLYHPETRTLVSGDAVLTLGGLPWFNPELSSTVATANTEERLRSLDVEHVLPGHGLAVSGVERWKRALPHTHADPGRGVLARCARRWGDWANAGR